MDDRTRKALLEADWKDIGIRLAAYASFKVRNRRWRDGYSAENLPRGSQPQDLAQQAIEKVLMGKRSWDPDEKPLFEFLKDVVNSLISHLLNGATHHRVRFFPDEDQEYDQLLHRHGLLSKAPDEATTAAASERVERLVMAVAGDEKLRSVLHALFQNGIEKPADVAEFLGIPVTDVYERLKALRKLAINIERAPLKTVTGFGVVQVWWSNR